MPSQYETAAKPSEALVMTQATAKEAPVSAGEWRALEELLMRVLGKKPAKAVVDRWAECCRSGISPQALIARIVNSPAVQAVKHIRTNNPAGHFYSPVVDPDTVEGYVDANRRAGAKGLPGIPFPLHKMEAFWRRNRDLIAATPFPEHATPEYRYSFRDGPYNFGDATTLRAMIADRRPRRVVEIGSGYTSACILDTVDELGLDNFRLTCIEPHPTRLRSILRESDENRVSVIEQGVQGQPLELFSSLNRNDILFIDSTHVMKTGSDVHYELFYILPALRQGVIIHVHDCRYPLEYSDIQIFEKNFSWNEVYVIQALLMNSNRYRVLFSGSYFAQERKDLVEETYSPYLYNPGSALWIEVVGNLPDVRSLGPTVADTITRRRPEAM